MKKSLVIGAFLSSIIYLTSCSTKSDNSYDVIGIYPLVSEYDTIYADQTIDSLTIVATRSWTAQITDSWANLKDEYKSRTIKNGVVTNTQIGVNFEVNLTGKIRTSQLELKSSLANLNHPYLQTNWLNVKSAKLVADDANYQNVHFEMNLPKSKGNANVIFFIYSEGATISSDADWAIPTNATYRQGLNDAVVKFEANNTGKIRTANLTIKSNGVSTVVKLIQEG